MFGGPLFGTDVVRVAFYFFQSAQTESEGKLTDLFQPIWEKKIPKKEQHEIKAMDGQKKKRKNK